MARHIIRIVRTSSEALKGVSDVENVDLIIDSVEQEFGDEEEAASKFEELKEVIWGIEDVPF